MKLVVRFFIRSLGMNAFANALMNPSHDALTANSAVSHSTSGSKVLDYFSKCGTYSKRDQSLVDSDMSSIFSEDEGLALKVLFYNRMVTRKLSGKIKTEQVQRGMGRKDEFVRSLVWLENNRPKLLKKNLKFIPVVGCWKDLWYDSPVTGFSHYVAPEEVYKLVKSALTDKSQRQLLAKYLPKLRSKTNRNNERHERLNKWIYGLLTYLKWSPRDYRKFKSNPENMAHLWQRAMSNNDWSSIDWNIVPGKALFQMTNNKGKKDKKTVIERHGLEKDFLKFLDKNETVKFTGYPYELYRAASGNRNLIQTHTLNKQFNALLEKAKDGVDNGILSKGVLCALDTSGSMEMEVQGKVRAIDVCVGLGIFFSSFLKGDFKNVVGMFNDTTKFIKLNGNFCDRVDQIKSQATAWGSTNFQGVIDSIVKYRTTHPETPISDYPKVLLVVSDMQFNPSCSWERSTLAQRETNYETAMRKLKAVGLPEITIVWWQVNGHYAKDVPVKMDDKGTVLVSGFDPSIVSAILGAEEVKDKVTGEVRKANPYEVMVNALNQEVLNLLRN
jgi:hypothetical protein